MDTRLWLTVTLTLSLFLWSVGLANTQSTPAPSQGQTRTKDKASPILMKMTGKITAVDEKARTFKLSSEGKEVIVDASGLPRLPKAGDVVEISYTDPGGGKPMKATNLNSSRSN